MRCMSRLLLWVSCSPLPQRKAYSICFRSLQKQASGWGLHVCAPPCMYTRQLCVRLALPPSCASPRQGLDTAVTRPLASSLGALTRHRPASGVKRQLHGGVRAERLFERVVLAARARQGDGPAPAAALRRGARPPGRRAAPARRTAAPGHRAALAMPAACPSSLFGAWLYAYSLCIAAQAAH